LDELDQAFVESLASRPPLPIFVKTTMGKGVSEAEGTHEYHGKPVASLRKACKDLAAINRTGLLKPLRESDEVTGFKGRPTLESKVNPGKRIVYTEPTACRAAFGKALLSIAEATLDEDGKPKEGYSPMAAFDCDLAGSVGLAPLEKAFPDSFFQCGIQENTAAMIAGTVSTRGVSSWVSMFGAFGHSMCYNEWFLAGINGGNVKLVTTHNSIDVGEDSKTHSPTNYLALSGHPGWQTFCPADANQADAIVRYMAANHGNMHMPVGRSKLPVITKQGSDEPFYGEDYEFDPQKFDILRDYSGGDSQYSRLYTTVIVTYGTPTGRAVEAADELFEKHGINVKVINIPAPKAIVHHAPDTVAKAIAEAGSIITFEDHNVNTGIAKELDSALLSHHQQSTRPEYWRHSWGMRGYSKSAPSAQLYKHFGLDKDSLVSKVIRDYDIAIQECS
jgi:transketolase